MQQQPKFNNTRTYTQRYLGNELVSTESGSGSDSEAERNDCSPLYLSIAKLASKASFRGNDSAREWLKAIMGLPEDHVLAPFDDETAKTLTELARQAYAAAQGNRDAIGFMSGFLAKTETDNNEETDETDGDACSDSHEETDETDSETDSDEETDETDSDAGSDSHEEPSDEDAFHCIVCYQVVTQERNPNKPCGRTKYLMDFQKRCRGCRVTEQQGA